MKRKDDMTTSQVIFWRLGNIHCMTPFRRACREALRNGNFYSLKRADRRKVLKYILKIWRGNRRMYLDVVNGNIG